MDTTGKEIPRRFPLAVEIKTRVGIGLEQTLEAVAQILQERSTQGLEVLSPEEAAAMIFAEMS
ncbi:MAG: hypothetical protein Q7S31_01705 [bacterium]|nr:hypothetical protein [bacterium]